jgi:ligand-binding sensor domain-containing protein/signal transduction histidine kinase
VLRWSLKDSNTYLEECIRRHLRPIRLLAAVTVFCFAVPAHATDPNRSILQYARARWGTDRGFPGGPVSCFAQTPDGYLWIGTAKGLARFDGVSFRVFDNAGAGSLPIGPVHDLLVDGDGNLWILLESTKILRYRDGQFEPGSGRAEFGITSILRLRDRTVVLSSLALGPLTYRAGRFELLTTDDLTPSELAATKQLDTRTTRLSWAPGLRPHRLATPSSPILAMAQTGDGRIWLGTLDRGLFYIEGGRVTAASKGVSVRKIRCLQRLDNQELWVGTDHGVVRWNGRKLTDAGLPASLKHFQVFAMIRDRDSNIWMGTSAGLLRFNSKGLSMEERAHQPVRKVTALFEDREGNIWAGGASGIESLRDTAFVTYAADRIPSESYGPIYGDSAGRQWFGPLEGGLWWVKDGRIGIETEGPIGRDVVYSIAGRKDELWLGRQHGGLTVLRFKSDSVTSKTYTQAEGLAQDSVFAVHASRDGTIWAATLNRGMSEFRDGRFTTYTTANGMSSNTVTSIAEASDGTMWFATPNGLNALTRRHWHVLGVRDGLPSADVTCLFVDAEGVFWIGTSRGLAFLVSGRVKVLRQTLEPLNEQILGMAEDKGGWLWIATSNHVLRVKRDKLLDTAITDADVNVYGLSDGLRGLEGVKRHRSVVPDAQGKIWFSLNRGLSVVDPDRVERPTPLTLIHVETILADGNAVDLNKPALISAARQRLTFSYAGLNLAAPEDLRFRYRLDGFDSNWSKPVTTREMTYTNLGPGKYRFRVIASGDDGRFSSREVVVPFQVLPLFWQTWWFRLSELVSCVLLIFAFYRVRVHQLARQYSLRLDERVGERTRIARELHDTLLQTIQASKLVADDALEVSSDPVRMLRAMEHLSVWLGQASQEGRAALNALRTSTEQTNDLADAFRQAIEDCRTGSQIQTSLSVDGEARDLHPLVRDEVYKIGFEAIRNAFMHSGGNHLDVRLSYGQNLGMRVKDDGVGIDSAVVDQGKDGHFGLQGMRERATRIGARLTVVSSSSTGTEISVVIDGRIVFRNPHAAPLQKIKEIFRRSRASDLN